jgi:hypothetical protein
MDTVLKDKLDKISDEVCLKLDMISSKLSPENLTCDGECTKAQVRKRYNELMKAWVKLEVEVGFKIEPEDFEWYFFKYREAAIQGKLIIKAIKVE